VDRRYYLTAHVLNREDRAVRIVKVKNEYPTFSVIVSPPNGNIPQLETLSQ